MKYLILILLLSGCYTVKDAINDTNKAFDKYPLETIDLLRKKAPCIPTDSSIVYKYIYKDDSTRFYQGKIDSLYNVKANVKDSLAIRYKDTCKSVIYNYDKAFNTGYDAGFYYGKKNCIPDTFIVRQTYRIKDVADSIYFAVSLINAEEQILKLQKKVSRKNVWITVFGIGFALCGLFIAAALYFKLRL